MFSLKKYKQQQGLILLEEKEPILCRKLRIRKKRVFKVTRHKSPIDNFI